MTETSFEINVPAPLLKLGLDREDIQRRVTEWLVLSLFVEERISSGKAARLLHMSRVQFLDLLRLRGVTYLNFSDDEMQEEFDAAVQLGNNYP